MCIRDRYLNGTLINGATSQIYEATEDGIYTLETTDANACESSATATIMVLENSISIISPAENSTYCAGSVMDINWSGVGVSTVDIYLSTDGGNEFEIIATDISTSIYEWSIPSDLVSADDFYIKIVDTETQELEAISASFTILETDLTQLLLTSCDPEEVGYFENTYINQNGCDSIVQITVLQDDFSTSQVNYSTCLLEDTGVFVDTLMNQLGCDSIVTTTINYVPLQVGLVETQVYLCPGDEVQLEASGGLTYNWSPAIGISNTTIPNPMVSPTVTTSYTVSMTNASGCEATATVLVLVQEVSAPEIIMTEDALIASDAITHQWYLNDAIIAGATEATYFPEVSGNYTVITTDENGCESSATAVFVIPSNSSITSVSYTHLTLPTILLV